VRIGWSDDRTDAEVLPVNFQFAGDLILQIGVRLNDERFEILMASA
jgi:hypothetical protein